MTHHSPEITPSVHTSPMHGSEICRLPSASILSRLHTNWHMTRFNHINRLDPKILNCSFVKLTANFPKRLTGLYVALCTGCPPHLHRIGKEPSPYCVHCPEESAPHFLLECQHYHCQRHTLMNTLGRKAPSLSYLVSDHMSVWLLWHS
jgi:hypothetical protein